LSLIESLALIRVRSECDKRSNYIWRKT